MLLGESMLHGAKRGQEVDVLGTEEQGPAAGYLQCRNISSGAVGLYPRSWVSPQPDSDPLF